jgi:ATP-dependent helicase HrpA
LGSADELKAQIIDVALDRAFLVEPLPNDEASFKRRIDEGRGRLTLIANEVARLALGVLSEFAQALYGPAAFGRFSQRDCRGA